MRHYRVLTFLIILMFSLFLPCLSKAASYEVRPMLLFYGGNNSGQSADEGNSKILNHY